jgi:hypothetical protein
LHLQIEVRRYNQHQLKFVLNGTRCLFHGAQCTMSPFRGSLLPTEGSILCPLLTCCRSPCPKYVRTTGRILLSNSSKSASVLFFFPSAKWSNDHIACFCRVKSIGHIGHLRLNDPGSLSICLLNLLQNVQYMCWFASVPQKFSKLFAFFSFSEVVSNGHTAHVSTVCQSIVHIGHLKLNIHQIFQV